MAILCAKFINQGKCRSTQIMRLLYTAVIFEYGTKHCAIFTKDHTQVVFAHSYIFVQNRSIFIEEIPPASANCTVVVEIHLARLKEKIKPYIVKAKKFAEPLFQ